MNSSKFYLHRFQNKQATRFLRLSFQCHSNADRREELNYDVESALRKLEEWKAHIVRAVHQDAAKFLVIDHLSASQVLLIMDWAMKFLPTSFRETQRDWFGKKGKSWHVTVAITKDETSNEIEVLFSILFTRINPERGRVFHFVLFASNHILSDKPIRSNALAYKWLQ